jgi:glycosyltransferase involved in cell wall biosynthesis
MIVVGGYPGDEESMLERARLEQLARELEVWRQVAFAGSIPRDRRRDFYAAADVVLTTACDASSVTTAVESMACGTPVIASEVADVRSTVRDGVTGFLVPPHAAGVITDRLLDGFADRPRLRRIGRKAARHARSALTWRRITEQLIGVYAAALADRRSASFETAAAV